MPGSQRPLKRFGQNFLTAPHIQKKIVNALQIESRDVVLEIGAGKGALTQFIVRAQPARFLAVELDPRWAELLQQQFGRRMELIRDDFLNIDVTQIAPHLKVIGNIPYHITSPIIFKLIDSYTHLQRAVLMVQKEVAQRLVAGPGSKAYGILSVSLQSYGQVRYLFEVKRGNFFPRPEVDSAVVQIDFFPALTEVQNETLYRKIIRHCFNYRRKMLRNSLSRIFDKTIVYSLESIDLNQRPEALPVKAFKNLANELNRKIKTGMPDD